MGRHVNKVHRPDKFRCHVCKTSFGCGKILRKHLRSHGIYSNDNKDKVDRNLLRLGRLAVSQSNFSPHGGPTEFYTGPKSTLYDV